MSIEVVSCSRLRCDKCSGVYSPHEEGLEGLWADPDDAMTYADLDGWSIEGYDVPEGAGHLCPTCSAPFCCPECHQWIGSAGQCPDTACGRRRQGVSSHA